MLSEIRLLRLPKRALRWRTLRAANVGTNAKDVGRGQARTLPPGYRDGSMRTAFSQVIRRVIISQRDVGFSNLNDKITHLPIGSSNVSPSAAIRIEEAPNT